MKANLTTQRYIDEVLRLVVLTILQQNTQYTVRLVRHLLQVNNIIVFLAHLAVLTCRQAGALGPHLSSGYNTQQM